MLKDVICPFIIKYYMLYTINTCYMFIGQKHSKLVYISIVTHKNNTTS